MLTRLVWACVVSLAVSARMKTDSNWLQTTVQGCHCVTKCETTARDNVACDVCETAGSCGNPPDAFAESSWDYCDFSPLKTFEEQMWQSKMEYWWSNLISDRRINPGPISFTEVFTNSAVTAFDNFLPEMPAGRTKAIHSYGSVCKIQMVINSNSPYTGLLAPGVQAGIVRMGDGRPIIDEGGTGWVPGVGWKFPRSGVPSGDFLTFVALKPVSWDYFGVNMSNHLMPGKSVSRTHAHFRKASQCTSQVGLSDLARYSQDGVKIADPRFPFKIIHVPSDKVKMKDTSARTTEQLMEHLGKIPAGTKLYSMYACAKPTSNEMEPLGNCGGELYLGDMETTSECTTSVYGDTQFHIRHQRVEDDWKLNPDYLNSEGYNAQRECSPIHESTIEGTPKSCGMLDSDA